MKNEVFRVMEEGFYSPEEYAKEGMPQCVPLVNSIVSADAGRIKSFIKTGDDIPNGHILICKVYLNKT